LSIFLGTPTLGYGHYLGRLRLDDMGGGPGSDLRSANKRSRGGGHPPSRARGDDRNRTGVDGFAGRCVATPPRRHLLSFKRTGVCSSARLSLPRAASIRALAGPAAVDRLDRFPGRLAQLGERRLDKAEVTGSSPVSPTEKAPWIRGFLRERGSRRRSSSIVFPHLSHTSLRWEDRSAGPRGRR
jgi:hypothetical protein